MTRLYWYRTPSQRSAIVVSLTDEQALSRLEAGVDLRPLFKPQDHPKAHPATTKEEPMPTQTAQAPKAETAEKAKRIVFDHSKCSHEGTSKARKICREERANVNTPAPAKKATTAKKPAAKKATSTPATKPEVVTAA